MKATGVKKIRLVYISDEVAQTILGNICSQVSLDVITPHSVFEAYVKINVYGS